METSNPVEPAPEDGGTLEVVGLTRRYGPTTALDGLSFAARVGCIVGFLGPNGAGKTTAMRVILGLERPDGGEVRWGGRSVGPAERLRFGYMPEQRGLYPKMAVGAQLVYFARLHGLSRDVASSAVGRWLERLGLADRAGDRLDKLSHGNQQRIQLAAALVHDPSVLLLDEPFSGLDPIGIEALTEVLRERAAAGATVVFSSHQLDLVQHVCEEVAIVDRGRLVLHGPLRALRKAGARALVVEVAGARPGWHDGLTVGEVTDDGQGRLRFTAGADLDAQDVLDRARAAGRVDHFAFEEPTLSELFRRSVAR